MVDTELQRKESVTWALVGRTRRGEPGEAFLRRAAGAPATASPTAA